MSNTKTNIFNTEEILKKNPLKDTGISVEITNPNQSNDEELGIVIKKTWEF